MLAPTFGYDRTPGQNDTKYDFPVGQIVTLYEKMFMGGHSTVSKISVRVRSCVIHRAPSQPARNDKALTEDGSLYHYLFNTIFVTTRDVQEAYDSRLSLQHLGVASVRASTIMLYLCKAFSLIVYSSFLGISNHHTQVTCIWK